MGSRLRLLALGVIAFSSLAFSPRLSAQAKRPFTVTDEIGLTLFNHLSGEAGEIHFSPDGSYFAVWTERGRVDQNRLENSLRFYRSKDVKEFLQRPNKLLLPAPVWMVSRSKGEGPIISSWRWLADSSGVAFLDRTVGGNQRLFLADLRQRTVEPLTSANEDVKSFDITDRQHYVYTSASIQTRSAKLQPPAVVGTDHSLNELILPSAFGEAQVSSSPGYLWAVVDGRRFQCKHDRVALTPVGKMALSPQGRTLVTSLQVPKVPAAWEMLYPPPYASDPYRMHPGGSANQYVLIDLQTGSVQALTDAPSSMGAGWWSEVFGGPSWSTDGQNILLPGTFIKSPSNALSRPCVAVVHLPSNTTGCIEALKGHTETGVEEGYHFIKDAHFEGIDSRRVRVDLYNYPDFSAGTSFYLQNADGTWHMVEQKKGVSEVEHDSLRIAVKEGINEAPLLIATNEGRSQVIWDPNPQVEGFDLGEATVYIWKDQEGRIWKGGLFKPRNYRQGERYPLVVQTHGFMESEFRPSGIFPTAFAARALAAAGILVLQVGRGGCPGVSLEEGPCYVRGFRSGVDQLVSQGFVDPDRIGIIGFSRTCYYVMEMLTTSPLHLMAASVTDGVMEDYFQYILMPDRISKEADSMVGASPFGKGLQQWIIRSPGFNLDKIHTPLMVVGEGPFSLLFMWEVYAGLHYLKKPVDLIMLNTDEHVLTNPAVRMASQGGSVDWFRFWLKGEERTEPVLQTGETKESLEAQYVRWRGLRKMQEENDKKEKAAKPAAAVN